MKRHLRLPPVALGWGWPNGGWAALPLLLLAGCSSLTGQGDVTTFDGERDADLAAEQRRASGFLGLTGPSRDMILRTNRGQRDTFAAMLDQRTTTIIDNGRGVVRVVLGVSVLITVAWMADRTLSYYGKWQGWKFRRKMTGLLNGVTPEQLASLAKPRESPVEPRAPP